MTTERKPRRRPAPADLDAGVMDSYRTTGRFHPDVDPERLGYAQMDDVGLASEEFGANRRAAEIEREEQRDKVLALRRTGASFRAIANQLDLTVHKTYRLYSEGLAALCPIESREETRQIELDRIDRLLLGIWTRATSGDDLEAIRVVDRLINTRIRLAGLDQIEVNVRTDPMSLQTKNAVERAITEKVMKMREREQWSSVAR